VIFLPDGQAQQAMIVTMPLRSKNKAVIAGIWSLTNQQSPAIHPLLIESAYFPPNCIFAPLK